MYGIEHRKITTNNNFFEIFEKSNLILAKKIIVEKECD